ncbi:MAG: hypothetical protein HY716_06390 [Planctomycetes bacterium]|nr:hypothetical protein [Planctomycetota bacterium]
MLERWMRALKGDPPSNGAELHGTEIVMSVPPALRADIGTAVAITPTYDAFARIFASAGKCLKIFVPYVDPSFTGLASLTKAPIKVLTTAGEGRGPRASPVLERCATMRDITVRYLVARREKALLYQMHAKLLLADGRRAYVGSANLTDTSLHYNLELGLYLEDPDRVKKLERLFDLLFDRAGVGAKML